MYNVEFEYISVKDGEYDSKKKKILGTLIASFVFATSVSTFVTTKVKSEIDKAVSISLSKETIKVGDEFNIEFNVKDIKDIYGASLDLNLDNSLIEIQEVIPGTIYDGLSAGVNYRLFRFMNEKDNGKLSSVSLLRDIDNGIDTSGSIFIVKAKALKSGAVNIASGANYTVKLSNSNKIISNKINDFVSKDTSFTIAKDKNDIFVKEKLDEVDSKIKYNGNWYYHWEPRNNGGSGKFTNAKTASFEFTFEGTGFRWYGLGNKSKGKAKITIDNKTEIVDTFSEDEIYQKLFYEKLNLSQGTHTVKVEVDSDYLNIDFIEILDDKENTPSTKPGTGVNTGTQNPNETNFIKKLEHNDDSIKYTGYWLNHWDNRNSGGSAKYANETNASVEFTFDGVGFKWYGLANKYKGKAKITIDGSSEIVDTYYENEEYQKLFYEKTGLANGKHTVKIETNTDYINIDYLEIIQNSTKVGESNNQIPSVPSLTGTWTSIEEDNSLIKYSGTWLTHTENKNSGGNAKYTNFRDASVEFSFIGTGFKWYGLANKYKGPVTVTIDGKSQRVETFSDEEQYKKLFFEKKGLEYGKHTVKLSVINDYLNIDYIEVENYKEVKE